MIADPRKTTRAAAAWVIAAALLFAAMALLTKTVSPRIPGPEVAFVRFSVGIAACVAAMLRVRFRAHNWAGLAARGGFGGCAVLCYFLAIEHLPVGIATLLNYTAPIFTAIWAMLFLGEKPSLATIGALVLTTFGVALVLGGEAPPGTLGLGRWQLVGILSSVLSGAAVAAIRQVRRTDGSWEIFASFCVVGALVTLPFAWSRWVNPDRIDWIFMALIGLLSVVAQIMLTYSLRFLKAAVAGILMQLTPVSAIFLGALILGERMKILSMWGAGITLIGVSWGAWNAASPAVASEEP